MTRAKEKQKWFHAIGVCGKTTSTVAKMYKDMGWFVTGTDLNYFEPAASFIKKNKIHFEQSYHYTHLTREFWEEKLKKKLNISDNPDLGLIVESASDKNKEYLFAKNKGIQIKPYAQLLGVDLIKDNSIVVVGTAGKTTTTALLTHILSEIGFNPSYMIGAEVIGLKDSLANTDSTWSVIEGDEYHSKALSNGAKFLEYKPKYLLLTNVGWEHQDVYPTKKGYIDEFKKVVSLVPKDGLIIAHSDNVPKEVLKTAKCRVIKYKLCDCGNKHKYIEDRWIVTEGEGVNFIYESSGGLVMSFKTDLLGSYNLENILAAVTLICNLPARKIPIDFGMGTALLNKMSKSIQKFKGVKKRLQILHRSTNTVIIDDFGVAPDRARNSLNTLREKFPDYKITAVFEPNGASRMGNKKDLKALYSGVFEDVEQVIIPSLSSFNKELITSKGLSELLNEMGAKSTHIESENLSKLISKHIKKQKKTLVVFFSSYRLTELANQLSKDL